MSRRELRRTGRRLIIVRPIGVLLMATLLAGACGSDPGSVESLWFEPSDGIERIVVDDAPVAGLATGLNDAGFDFLRSLRSDENLVLSPASIGHTLLMAQPAADGPTGERIAMALRLPEEPHRAWNAIDAAIAAGNGSAQGLDDQPTPLVRIADRIWPSETAQPDQSWIDLLAEHHGADVEAIDTGRPEASRDRVNAWISEQTVGLIPELLPQGFITPETELVLTDAVYFKAQWHQVFGKYGEVETTFTRLDGSSTPVTLMRDLEQPGRHGAGDGYVAGEVGYLGGDHSMLVIVPDEGRFAEIRDRLSSTFLDELDAAAATGPWELQMATWETASALDLLPWLTEIGAAPGSYPGIGPGVFLAGGVHAADIEVDEIGTVAAAATALGFDESGPPEPALAVITDRPFLYLIRHVGSGLVLFAGQVTDLPG